VRPDARGLALDAKRNACGSKTLSRAQERATISEASSSAMSRRCNSRQNSARTCRQIPHGGAGFGPPVKTMAETGLLSPAAIMAETADLSAQRVAPYVAFSTLHPA